jgi:hypothetical protein
MRSRRFPSAAGLVLAMLAALAILLQGSLSGQHGGGVDPNKLFGTVTNPMVGIDGP